MTILGIVKNVARVSCQGTMLFGPCWTVGTMTASGQDKRTDAWRKQMDGAFEAFTSLSCSYLVICPLRQAKVIRGKDGNHFPYFLTEKLAESSRNFTEKYSFLAKCHRIFPVLDFNLVDIAIFFLQYQAEKVSFCYFHEKRKSRFVP